MNIRNLILVGVCLISLTACPPNESVMNEIHKDGSITRTVVVDADDDSLEVSLLCVPVDSTTWTMYRYELDSTSGKDYQYVFTKTYTDADEINEDYKNKPSKLQILDRDVKVKYNFLWFFNTIQYEETYYSIFEPQDFSLYMTNEEREIYFWPDQDKHPKLIALDSAARKQLKDDIEEKYEWLFLRGMLASYLHSFNECLVNENQTPLQNQEILETYDSLINKPQSKDLFENDFDKLFLKFLISLDVRDSVSLKRAHNCLDQKEEWKLILERFELVLGQSYENQVRFNLGPEPATLENDSTHGFVSALLDANMDLLMGDTLIWKVDGEKFLVNDFVMSAKLKSKNVWSYWLSGGIILLAFVLIFYKPNKRP